MRITTPSRRRQGVNLVVATSMVAMLAMAAGFTSSRSARRSGRWTQRHFVELTAQQVARAALEEATHEVVGAMNQPGSPAFAALRSAGDEPVTIPVELPRAHRLAGELAQLEALEVHVQVVRRSPLTTWSDPATEWRGHLELVAAVRWDGGELRAEDLREVQANRLRLPYPFDRYCHYDHRGPRPGQVAGPISLGPSYFAPTASLRVEPGPDGDVQGPFEELLGTTRELRGVIYVANAGARPLRLSGRRLRGRAVVVVEGELVVNELRVEDPALDRIALVALGDATLVGEVEADVLLSHGPGATPPTRELFRGLEVRGSFLVSAGEYQTRGPFDLDCGDGPRRQGPEDVQLSLSPSMLASKVTFPPAG
jgi:hypothetical protein